MDRNFLEELASLVHRTEFAALPAATIRKARLHLLDTIGVGIAGAGSDETGKASSIVRGSIGAAQVWGRPDRVSARDASFLNGISAHAYELDDCGGCDHSGAVVVPAALALLPTPQTAISGRELILSVAMGYEVGRRVLEACGGYEVHNGLGWHSTGTCGVFGAATSAALVLKLGERKLASAMGIACSLASGTWGFIHDGSQTKKLHSGRAAEGGVMAALLAEAAFSGPRHVLQPETWGSYLTAFGRDKGDPEALVADYGKRWRIDRCSIKPYATCRGTHSAIDAVDVLLSRHALPLESIASVEARMSTFQAGMCGGSRVNTRAQAQMSLPYAVAAKLSFGKVFLDELEEEAFRDRTVVAWLERTTVLTDPSMADEAEPEITFVTTSGQRFSTVVDDPLGSPAAPLPEDRLIEKFRNLAERRLDRPRVQQLVDYVLDIDAQPDVRGFTALLASAEAD